MNTKYTFLDVLLIALIISFLIGGYFRIVTLNVNNMSELLVFTGIWLIVCFIVLLGVVGVCKGVPRHMVKVRKIPAIVVFSTSVILFTIAFVLNGGF